MLTFTAKINGVESTTTYTNFSLLQYDISNNKSNLTEATLSGKSDATKDSCNYLFSGCSNLTFLDLSNLDTSGVDSMQGMFYNCSALVSLNLSSFNTSDVTSMYSMFYNCSSLTSLDLSNFDASNVTSMAYMFSKCSSLTSLNLSNFNTSNATRTENMFDSCEKLTLLDLSNFNTSNVTNMFRMFANCSSLTSLDLSNFDTGNVTNMEYLFSNCSSLTSLVLSSFDTSNVTMIDYMFSGCKSLTSLNLSSFNTSNVTQMYSMMRNCTNLKTIYSNDFDILKVTDSSDMFSGCKNLVGAIAYDSTKTDAQYANTITGYFTKEPPMAIPFLSSIDLNKNELKNAVVQNLKSAPINPKNGQIYYNSENQKTYYYNGSDWVDMSGEDKVTGDTLPIGSIVEFDGINIPENWEEVEENLNPPTTYVDTGGTISLNDYTDQGWYFFTTTNTITNIPAGVNGWLQVIKDKPLGTWAKQIWYRAGTINSNDYQTYVRTLINGVWSSWKQYQMVEDSGWQTLTLTSDFKAYENVNDNIPKYRKVGQLVEIMGVVAPTSEIPSGTNKTIAILPEGYRPAINRFFICQGSGRNIWTLYVYTNGNIIFARYGSSAYAAASTSVWLPFNATFLVD